MTSYTATLSNATKKDEAASLAATLAGPCASVTEWREMISDLKGCGHEDMPQPARTAALMAALSDDTDVEKEWADAVPNPGGLERLRQRAAAKGYKPPTQPVLKPKAAPPKPAPKAPKVEQPTPKHEPARAEPKPTAKPDPEPAKAEARSWCEPTPLDERVPEPMRAGILPGWLGEYVECVARFTETPRELAAAFALAVIATTVQRRFTVQIEPGYFEPLAFWVVAAMASGNRKSAVLKELARPLIEIERKLAAAAIEDAKAAKSEAATIEAKTSTLRSRAAKADGVEFEALKKEIAEIEATMPEPAKPARLFAQDITTERLGSWLAENGERGSILSDEGGLFDLLAGRYSNGIPNLDLYLQGHCASFVRVDRGSRPAVVLNHPCLTIGLSPQPAVLSEIVARKDFRGRGLLARFLYLIPRSQLGHRTLKPHPIPDGVRRHYIEGITALADIPPRMQGDRELPYILQLDTDAYSLWKSFQAEVETLMREDGQLEHLTDWASKLPGACARVAGLLHAADFASCLADNLTIRHESVDRAIGFCRTAIEHAVCAFDRMGADPATAGARKVLAAIKREKAETFILRNLWNHLRATFPTVADLEPSLTVLESHGYIQEGAVRGPNYAKRGRPSRGFYVNPAIWEGER